MSMLVILIMVAVIAAACGAPDVTGTYTTDSGALPISDVVLSLEEGGTFEITGDNPLTGQEVKVPGEWTQDGDMVTLDPGGPFGPAIGQQTGTYENGRLMFGEYTFEKQE